MTIEVTVPDIGDFSDVPVINILVAVGDTVAREDPLIELESDKATMEVPSPAAGRIVSIAVKEGDTVAKGSLILTLEAAEGGAAFRAADLGKKVVLIEKNPTLGGVCLNVGCIPSKALLHAAKVITETEEMAGHGIAFAEPTVDLDKLRGWKDSVVRQLTGGLSGLAKGRKVQVVSGYGRFTGPNMIEVEDGGTKTTVSFDQCIIAAGSEPVTLPFIPHDDPRVIDSTGALELGGIPDRLLVLGGGIIGLEMACVYDALGSRITVVELMDQIIPGADKDIVKPLHKRIEGRYEKILLKTRVTGVQTGDRGLTVTFEDEAGGTTTDIFDKILVAVGRRPNGGLIGAEAAGVVVDQQGFIAVDSQQRTNVPHIFAIGDVVGQPMLAHKAVHVPRQRPWHRFEVVI